MGVYRPDRPDIHQVSVFTVGMDGAEQRAAGISDDVFSPGNYILICACAHEQRHR